jgi:ankyrin repeat protein
MSGAEALFVLGTIANVVALVDFSIKALARMNELSQGVNDVPESFQGLKEQLLLLGNTLEAIRAMARMGELDETTCQAIEPAILSFEKSLGSLKKIFEDLIPQEGASNMKIWWKAIQSLRKDKEVEQLSVTISGFVQALTLRFTVLSSKTLAERLSVPEQKPKLLSSRKRDPTAHEGLELWAAEEERKCLQLLRTSEYEAHKIRNPDRVPGTCKWFLNHSTFTSWTKNETAGILWVSADPGCGKSVLVKSLLDNELKSTDERITSYFFFKDDSKDHRSVTKALSALLHQLCCWKPSLITHAMNAYFTEGNMLPELLGSLWKVLVSIGSDPDAGEVICILDALDECDQSDRKQLIDLLTSYYSTESNKKRLKFIVTSRPYTYIEDDFFGLTSKIPLIRLAGENESEMIRQEINLVIKYEVNKIAQRFDLQEDAAMLEQKLLEADNRTYLWLHLTLSEFRYSGITSDEVHERIETLPETLYEAYESILAKIDRRDAAQARRLLHIIVAAERPLTLKEMNAALAVKPNNRKLGRISSEKAFRSRIRSLCGLFVNIVGSKIYLIHQTAKEFLVAKNTNFLPSAEKRLWQESLVITESNFILAEICINYLLLSKFEDSPLILKVGDSTDQKTERDEEISQYIAHHCFLEYTARYWSAHFSASDQKNSTLFDAMLDLIDSKSPRFQTWLSIRWAKSDETLGVPTTWNSLFFAAYAGFDTVVQNILAVDEASVEAKDNHCRTPLTWAARNGHQAVVQLLLATNKIEIDLRDKLNRTALNLAAGADRQSVVKLLLATGKADVNAREDVYGHTPLLWVAGPGFHSVLKLLLETGKVDVNAKDKYERTALQLAAEQGHDKIIKILLAEEGIIVDWGDTFNQTPLFRAAAKGHEATVKLFLATGKVNIDVRANNGCTPLLAAAQNGHESVVRLLLATGKVDVNAKLNDNQRPVIAFAAMNGHASIVSLLLATGQVDTVDAKDSLGRTPFSLAAGSGHDAVLKLLLATGEIDIDGHANNGCTPLLAAAERGHESTVSLLLETGKVDINATTQESNRPVLSFAAINGHAGVVKLLLASEKVEIDSGDKDGRTPLSLAAEFGATAVVKFLLETGKVDINAKDNDYGESVLSWAAEWGHDSVVNILLNTQGIEIDAKDDKSGQTALLWATKYGHFLAVRQLLEHGADWKVKDDFGLDAAFKARQQKNTAIYDLLLQYGANDECRDKHGRPPRPASSRNICDGCGVDIPDLDISYRCATCNDGDFDLCQMCYEAENNCKTNKHSMTKVVVGEDTNEDSDDDEDDDTKG